MSLAFSLRWPKLAAARPDPVRSGGDGALQVGAAPVLSAYVIVRRFWPYTAGSRRTLLVSLLCVAAGPAIETATILLYRRLIDDVVVPHDLGSFPTIGLAYLGLTLLASLAGMADRYLSARAGQQFVVALRTGLFRHLHDLSLAFFEQHRLGDLLARLTGDVGAIETFVVSGLVDTLAYTARVVFFAGALFVVDWRLTGVILLVGGALWGLTRRFAGPIKHASREKRARGGSLAAVAEESLANSMLVQACNQAEYEARRFHEQTLASLAAELKSTRLKAAFSSLVDVVEAAGVLGVVALGAWELDRGVLSLGGVLVFLTYLTRLYGPIRGLGDLGTNLVAASAAAERIVELLDRAPSVVEAPRARRLTRARGHVVFDGVSFAYPGASRPAIQDVSFGVGPGELVALVGASGAGKSTLARLLLRFYDPRTGHIRLDGHDLRDLTLGSLREQVATLLQETLVFDGTIRENILYGRPDATEAEMRRAAADADADTFISMLPDGYDTRVGQKGRCLSGGQRQRIAIARAMIRNAPLLLLDEPTTGLDAESSLRILEPLRRLTSGRTTIVVSHNLLTVRDATCILVLDGGTVVERGTHAELVARDGLYARLYRLHQPGATPSGEPAVVR